MTLLSWMLSEEGRAAARRGDLVQYDEVVERIEQMFRS